MSAASHPLLPAMSRRFCERLGLKHPLVLAPMLASSTPELVAGVAKAGALAQFGLGLQSPQEMRAVLEAVRRLHFTLKQSPRTGFF